MSDGGSTPRKKFAPMKMPPSPDSGRGGPDRDRDRSAPRRGDGATPDRGPRPPRAVRTPDTATPDAIEAARARALGSSPDRTPVTPISVVDVGEAPDGEVVRMENLPTEKRSFFERLSSESILDQDNTKAAAAVAGASIGVAVASAVGIANLKSAAIGAGALYVGWKSLPVVDWFARGMDQLADKMIDKKLPGVKFIMSLFDKSAKMLGLDKSLYEHLKKNKEDRVKLADKLLKELRASEKKYESKLDAAAKKQKRQKVLESKLGKDVADLLIDELDEASKKEETPVAAAA